MAWRCVAWILVALLLIILVLCVLRFTHLKREAFAVDASGKNLGVDKATMNTLNAGTINLSRNMNITSRSSSIMHGGRLHVAPQERMYLMPKKGVHVSKAWGGSGDLGVAGTTSLNGQLTMAGSNTIRAGRLHVAPSEQLHLLPKQGVHIAKAWGSSGDLTVAGTTMLNGPTTWMNNLSSRGRMHVHPNERLYLLPKKGVHLAKAWGSTGDLSVQGDTSLGKLNVTGHTNMRSLDVNTINVKRNLVVNGGTNLHNLTVTNDAGVNRNLDVKGHAGITRNLGVKGHTDTRSLAVASDARVNRNLNVGGVTRTRTLTATQDANVKRNLTVAGTTRLNGSINMTNRKGNTIECGRRLQVASRDKVYLLPKKGVHVAKGRKAWGGNGNLEVEGTTSLKGDLNMERDRSIRSSGKLDVAATGEQYLSPKQGVHITKNWGGSGDLTVDGTICMGKTCIAEGNLKGMLDAVNFTPMNCIVARNKYLATYPDIARTKTDPWKHWNAYGRAEGRRWTKCPPGAAMWAPPKPPPPPPKPEVMICDWGGCDAGGFRRIVGKGFHNLGSSNDRISHMVLAKNTRVRVWEHHNRDGKGRSALFVARSSPVHVYNSTLKAMKLHNNISSMEVSAA